MRKFSKFTSIIVTIILVSIFNFNISFAANSQKTSTDINSINTNKYPGIKEKIQELQKKHPNWEFKILYTNLNWNTVIANEYVGHGSSPKNLVPANNRNYSGDWVCSICRDKKYDSGAWVCASESAIKYMMDPRNSINETDVFQFQELSYNGYDNSTINGMVRGTFLDSKSIKNTIKTAAKTYNVSPYYLVARILQEQGTSGTVLTRGKGYNNQYIGLYNVFNIGASGSGKDQVILRGLKKAKDKNWTSLEKSITGGTEEIAKGYIARGQNTLYLQKFDVDSSDNSLYFHQYMQNILAAQKEGTTLRKTYNTFDALNAKYTFLIPVYENMPAEICKRPSTTESNQVTTDIVRVNVNSSIRLRDSANGPKTIGYLYKDEIVTRLEKATKKINGTYWDKVMKSDGTSGYVARETSDNESTYKKYLIEINNSNNNSNNTNNTQNNSNNISNVSNSKIKVDTNAKIVTIVPNATISDLIKLLGESIKITNDQKQLSGNDIIATNDKINSTYIIAKLGDINGDGKIDTADLLQMQKHLLAISKIKNSVRIKSADINGDGKIDTADLLKIQKKLLGISDITF